MAERSNTLNFAAGPSKLPDAVLAMAKEGLTNYKGCGMGVMELSHRSATFGAIIDEARQSLRQLLEVPDNFSILFMQGGGFGQFACVPLNLMGEGGKADYIVTGAWTEKAAAEAKKYGAVNVVNTVEKPFQAIEEPAKWRLSKDASYVFMCDNETVHGIEHPALPDTAGVPLVVDMSSNFLTRPIDFAKVGMVFAGAQKNSGCAGVTVVIVRDDLLGKAAPSCPAVFSYTIAKDKGSMLNTPPTWSIFIASLVYKWGLEQGGVEAFAKQCAAKSSRIYGLIDGSDGFYRACVAPAARSRVNIPLRIGQGHEALEKKFLEEAEKGGLLQLKGHRSVGGIRASLYNAITVGEAECLAKFMETFAAANRAALTA